jgi:hypothetical protein
MTPVTGDRNEEGEAMRCSHFLRGRGGGGEVAPLCRRQTTQEERRGGWRGRRRQLVSGG